MRLKIADEKGDLDELKCLQLMFNPQMTTISSNAQNPLKCFIAMKPCESFYTDFTENYAIKFIDIQSRKTLLELKMSSIDSIIMKNMIQKQFIISAENNKMKVTIDFGSAEINDTNFQALNYIY